MPPSSISIVKHITRNFLKSYTVSISTPLCKQRSAHNGDGPLVPSHYPRVPFSFADAQSLKVSLRWSFLYLYGVRATITLLSTLTSRATHAHPTSPRSTGFCAIWDCTSSSSSSLVSDHYSEGHSPQGDNGELRQPRQHPQQPRSRYIGVGKKRDLYLCRSQPNHLARHPFRHH